MVINIKNDINLSSFYVVFKGSVMNERPGWYGISHLMEHLLCKGLDPLMDEFQRYDISWNAYTSDTEIVFYMNGLDKYVNIYKEKFLNSLLSYSPTEKELEHEKKIVIEEYKESFNNQLHTHFLNLYRKRFKYYSPIGLGSDIENYTIDDCIEYQENFLKSPSLIINVSKNNIYKHEGDFLTNINDTTIIEYDNVDTCVINDNNKIVEHNKIPLELFNEFKNKSSIINISPLIHDDYSIIKFIIDMLGDGLNSPLYREIREKHGLVYYVGSVIEKLDNNSSVIMLYTETSNENVEKVQTQFKYVLENKEKFLTQERFDVVKDNHIVKIEKRKILVHNNIRKYIDGDEWDIEKIIHKLTLKDIHDVFDKYFKWDDFHKSIYKDEFK